jgi:hypothetical protein
MQIDLYSVTVGIVLLELVLPVLDNLADCLKFEEDLVNTVTGRSFQNFLASIIQHYSISTPVHTTLSDLARVDVGKKDMETGNAENDRILKVHWK